MIRGQEAGADRETWRVQERGWGSRWWEAVGKRFCLGLAPASYMPGVLLKQEYKEQYEGW